MSHFNRTFIFLLGLTVISTYAYASVTYRVISTLPDRTQAAIDIKEQALYWSLVLRFDNKVKLKILSGASITSSSPQGNIYILAGQPIGPGQSLSVIFESKYVKKSATKLTSATYNGRPVKVT